MKRITGSLLVSFATIWNVIAFLGSFYFPYLSPAYRFNPTAIRLKELWYVFIPGDILLLFSILLTIFVVISRKTDLSVRLLKISGILSIVKGTVNTLAYMHYFGSISPSFMNIFSGLILILSSGLFLNGKRKNKTDAET